MEHAIKKKIQERERAKREVAEQVNGGGWKQF